MQKKIIIGLSLILFLVTSNVSLADNSPAGVVGNVFQSAKEALDTLVETKDAGNVDNLVLRINTFDKILDLSINEAKDYVAKLVAVEKNSDYDVWVSFALSSLSDSIDYYNSQKAILSSSTLDLDGIKKMALDFKNWREKNYLPLLNQIQSFFLIKDEAQALNIADKRLNNIKNDLTKITLRAKDRKNVNNYLLEAKNDLSDARLLNQEAYNKFLNDYVSVLVQSTSSTSSTSSDISMTSSLSNAFLNSTTTFSISESSSSKSSSSEVVSSTSTSSTTQSNASSSDVVGDDKFSQASIKDLVSNSLTKIKSAYQNFIEISNYVRKLLM